MNKNFEQFRAFILVMMDDGLSREQAFKMVGDILQRPAK